MIEIDYQDFCERLEQYFTKIANSEEVMIIKSDSGERIMMMSLEEYSAIKETLHLLSSKANADRLFESIQQTERKLE